MNGTILVKRLLSAFAVATGILPLAERLFSSDRALVLMYHRVLEKPLKQPVFIQEGMYVKASTFEKQIVFLKKKFRLVFLDELVDMIAAGENVGGCCSITFDDGWRDNFLEAFPLLKKYRVPATVFLASGFVGTEKVFWPDYVGTLLGKLRQKQFRSDPTPPELARFLEESCKLPQENRNRYFERCIEIMKGFTSEERSVILDFFRGSETLPPIPRQMMTWEEAREMLTSGLVRFGAHTVSHEILDQVPSVKMRNEVAISKSDIEDRLGCTVRTFAYPNGNHNDVICAFLSLNGFSGAVTTRRGFLSSATPLMKIPRVGMHEDVSSTIPMFRARMMWRGF